MTDLGATPGVKIKLVDHSEVVEKMNAKYGGVYLEGVIPAKTYPGQDKDNKISVVQNILVADAKLPEKTVYDIVKTLFESVAISPLHMARRRRFRSTIRTPRTPRSRGIRARKNTSRKPARRCEFRV